MVEVCGQVIRIGKGFMLGRIAMVVFGAFGRVLVFRCGVICKVMWRLSVVWSLFLQGLWVCHIKMFYKSQGHVIAVVLLGHAWLCRMELFHMGWSRRLFCKGYECGVWRFFLEQRE